MKGALHSIAVFAGSLSGSHISFFLEISNCSLPIAVSPCNPSLCHTFLGQYVMQVNVAFGIICSPCLFVKQKNREKRRREDEE